MCKRKTNQYIDSELINNNRNIIRLEDYINIDTPIKFKCLICEYIWKTSPYTVINKKGGCPKCAGSLKLTNEIIDQRLIDKNRNIERLSEYKNSKSIMEWGCKICQWNWKTSANNILNNETGCPKCAGLIKLTNEDIDQKLINDNRNIIRLEDYINADTPINFKCTICNYIWKTAPKEILNRGTGCYKCFRIRQANELRFTCEEFDEKIKHKNIQRLEEFLGIEVPINFKCLICNYIWKTKPSNTMRSVYGCPQCAGNFKLTNEYIDQELIKDNRNIKRVDDYININSKMNWICLVENCNHMWKTSTSKILNKKTGCPKCSKVLKLTNEIIDERLKDRDIERMEDVINTMTPIKWRCKKCKNCWSANPDRILRRNGCPSCKHKNENICVNLLNENNIYFEYQKNIKELNIYEINRYRLDFYFPNIKLAIEYNGIQHYKPTRFSYSTSKNKSKENFIKQKLRDKYVQNFCNQNNIKLIQIDGRKYKDDKLKEYIINEIIPMVKDK